MSGPYRFALIGCGFFAQNHLHAWSEIPEVELVAVCDIDPERASAAAAAFGGRAYTDAAELFSHRTLSLLKGSNLFQYTQVKNSRVLQFSDFAELRNWLSDNKPRMHCVYVRADWNPM
jgi:hypothetical protein